MRGMGTHQTSHHTCLACRHYLPSAEAGQRAYINGYGYCKAGPTRHERSMFFNAANPCWLKPARFEPWPLGCKVAQ